MIRNMSAILAYAVSVTFAQAADPYVFRPTLTPEQAQPAPPQRFDWNRCYVGGQGGIKDVNNQIDFTDTAFYKGKYIAKTSTNLLGPIVGAQVGCNALFDNGFLVGFELEGVYGHKHKRDCDSMDDPVSRCTDIDKKKEAFLTARVGYTFNMSPLCNCDDRGFLVYGRFGVGYTRSDLKTNVNATSYLYTAESDPQWPANSYRPIWSHAYNMNASKSFIAPVLGFGVERALDRNWTIRGDVTSMISMASKADLTVDKIDFATYGAGTSLPRDFSGVTRHPSLGDKLPIKIQEVETKMTIGLNRLF